jgi:hypothetical protein
MEPKDSLPCSQQPATGPIQSQMHQSTPSHSASLRSILILSSHLRLGFYVTFSSKPLFYSEEEKWKRN